MSTVLAVFGIAIAALWAAITISVVLLFAIFGVGVCSIIGRLLFSRQFFGGHS